MLRDLVKIKLKEAESRVFMLANLKYNNNISKEILR